MLSMCQRDTCRLPEVLLQQQPVSLRFQLPAGYPSAEPPLLSVECSANRYVLALLLHSSFGTATVAARGSGFFSGTAWFGHIPHTIPRMAAFLC